MKKRIVTFFLLVGFLVIVIGTLGCGCLLAATDTAQKVASQPACHPEESSASKEKCCSGCRLEEKASFPTQLGVFDTRATSGATHHFKHLPSLMGLSPLSSVATIDCVERGSPFIPILSSIRLLI